MQIGGPAQFANGGATTSTLNAGTASARAAQDDMSAGDDAMEVAPSSMQDDAVQISPQGYAAASTGNANTDAGSGETSAQANAQPMKSLVYGALGLERPDQEADPNHAYTVGKWIAAGITLGGIVSLFI